MAKISSLRDKLCRTFSFLSPLHLKRRPGSAKLCNFNELRSRKYAYNMCYLYICMRNNQKEAIREARINTIEYNGFHVIWKSRIVQSNQGVLGKIIRKQKTRKADWLGMYCKTPLSKISCILCNDLRCLVLSHYRVEMALSYNHVFWSVSSLSKRGFDNILLLGFVKIDKQVW